MHALTHYSLTLKRKRYFILAMLILLAGCGGGLVGTGDGPKDTTIYQLKELPDRISPDIPKHLEIIPDEPTNDLPKRPAINKDRASMGDSLNLIVRAESWEALNSELTLLAILRLDAQHSITLTDLAIDEIIGRCQQDTECLIPAGDIRLRYTQPVINRLIKLYTDTLGSTLTDQEYQSEYLQDVISKLSQLFGTEVVLGETNYSKLGGTPYDYRLKTSLMQLDVEREFTVQWRDDKSVAELVSRPVVEMDASFVLSYFYQTGSPGESAIAKVESTSEGRTGNLNIKVISNNAENTGILLESHGTYLGGQSSSSTDSVSVPISAPGITVESVDFSVDQSGTSDNENNVTEAPDVEVGDTPNVVQNSYSFKTVRTVQGQIDNDGGYATVEEYDIPDESPESINYVRLYRETFDDDGSLLAGEICQEYSAINRCDTDTAFTVYGPGNAALVDSRLYYSPGDFSVLESVQDAIRWQVVNLPDDVRELAVVSAETGTALTARAYLCLGYQVVPGNTQLFCGATDDQLSGSTEVINVAPGETVRLIPSARLVQAD